MNDSDLQELMPQTAADWQAVAARFIDDSYDASQSSPLFAALVAEVQRGRMLATALDYLHEHHLNGHECLCEAARSVLDAARRIDGELT